MSSIVIIGSANMDTTHYLNGEFPENLNSEGTNLIKETLRLLGGKGANQAVSTRKQSKPEDTVSFIGCIGKDEAGIKILEKFKEMGINYSGVKVLDGMKTDGRIITVNKNGDNRMIGYGDCVKQLTIDMLLEDDNIQDVLNTADIIMIQMKMPADTVEFVVNYCAQNGKRLIIDPTPSDKSSSLVTRGLLNKATYLTPNEEEAYTLSQYLKGHKFDEIKKMFENTPKHQRLEEIRNLVQQYPNIIATLGENGVLYNNNGTLVVKKPYQTQCKDSTGAGDTFNGAFVAAIARGENLDMAISYGQMNSARKIEHKGAQNGMQTYEETKEALAEEKNRVHS